MKKIILLITVLIATTGIKAQLTVTNSAPYNSPSYMVNNVLMGSGVSASNITFSGDSNQIGFFNNGLAGAINPLGLDSGIVISSGNVNDIPNGGGLSTGFGGAGDPDLLTIAQTIQPGITSSVDAAALEFDFIPQGDTVEFRFVFASDEYLTWINSNFNDIFAFFLSGPGYTGPYASPAGFPGGATNLAIVPGTTSPITISTIYVDPSQTPPSVNGSFYINNPGENTFAFNGYTTTITIKFGVTCNATYHFKFAVSDCSDGALDTGVFMEGSSFSSEAIEVNVVAATGDSTVIEGCADANIIFTRPDTAGPLTVQFGISGNAINGVDYNLLADSVTFLAGIDTASINITPIADFLVEGQDTIVITVISLNQCGDTVISIGTIYILDLPNMFVTSSDTLLTCPLASFPLSITPGGALAPYSYVWTDTGGNPIGSNSNTITVSGLITDTFYVSVTDSCNLVTTNDTIIVTVNNPALNFASLTILPNDTIHCGQTATLGATGTGGTPGYTYSYSPSGPSVTPLTTTNYTITITDACSFTTDSTITITVDTVPITITSLYPNDTINCGESVTLSATAGGGTPAFTYSYSPSGPVVTPQALTTYTVSVTDQCYTFDTTITITVDTLPVSFFTSNDTTTFCPGQPISLSAFPANGTTIYNYAWSPGGPGATVNLSPSTTTTYYVTATGACNVTATDSILATVDYTVVTSSLTNDIILECENLTYPVEVIATMFNGLAPFTYNWGSSSADTDSIINISVSTTQAVTLNVTDFCGFNSTSTMVVSYAPYTPMSINIDPADSTCAGEFVSLIANATNGLAPYTYSWTNGNTNNPTTFTSELIGNNNVTVTVTDKCTLEEEANIDVKVIICDVFAVNVITPNSDLLNDFLEFRGLGHFPNNHLVVLNRWGKTIYEQDNYQNDWSGGKHAEGTYYYVLTLNDPENIIKKGYFTLLK